MTARRQARATRVETSVGTVGGIPRCLLIGRCIEVWSGDRVPPGPLLVPVITRTRRRYSTARSWWVRMAGIGDKESWQTLPCGPTWSADFIARSGRTQQVDDRLAHIGCSVADLSALAGEADQLHRRALLDDREDTIR